jgi:pyruvate/2-oxoglutarate dehydrogenase complex dihydrolipoamide dehydrogenase (E3) component
LQVFWGEGADEHDDYDTVLVAIGRHADTKGLGLDKAGVKVEGNGKIKAQAEQTNVAHIYAIGDMLYGREELTPVAIQAGSLLASRLYGNATQQMDYDKVCTTVFTPLEYGYVHTYVLVVLCCAAAAFDL